MLEYLRLKTTRTALDSMDSKQITLTFKERELALVLKRAYDKDKLKLIVDLL